MEENEKRMYITRITERLESLEVDKLRCIYILLLNMQSVK